MSLWGDRAPSARHAVLGSSGAALSTALQWAARHVGVADANVAGARVEFVIDARVRWTEHHPAYVFNGDGNKLFPWILGPGPHRLAVRILTSGGKRASTSASVTVSDPISVQTHSSTPLPGT